QGYRNDLIPKARGEAVKMTKEAEGYKIERIKKQRVMLQNLIVF
ncbi:unnamed protein product, partial [marine sediment metagenome]